MNDLDKAREWAAEITESRQTNIRPDAFAAAEVIQSLPDQWVDAEKVREVLDMWAESPFPTSDGVAVLNDFEALLTPSLPTLAELIEQGNDPKQYQWMRAKDSNGEDLYLTRIMEATSEVVYRDGMTVIDINSEFTPLPGEPKLVWPSLSVSGESESVSVETEDVTEESDPAQEPRNPETPPAETVDTPSSDTPLPPRPEDVPPGEPWLVLSGGRRAIGYRNDHGDRIPWGVAYQGCVEFDYCYDSDITLVSRLVPEVAP